MDKKLYICDTNVFLSGLISKNSPPNTVVRYLLEKGLLAFSKETFSELEEVIHRDKFDKIIPIERRRIFLINLKNNGVFYDIENKINICRDPKDNMLLDVAIASYADYLVTGDNDLLVLKNIRNTSIITPREFIELLDTD